MPQYRVKAKGVYEGKLYDPAGKRKVITTAEPIEKDKMPSWVEPMKAPAKTEEDLTPAQKAARTKAANKAAKEAEKENRVNETDVPEANFLSNENPTNDEPETI